MKKPLGFDDLIARVRALAGALPDSRTGTNTPFSIADIALAAFSVFFTQCPSFLSFQQNMELSRARNNARSLFQVERIPTDNHIRQTLDPVAPKHLMELFDDLHRAFDEHGLLPAMRAVQDTRLIALDATWYFSSSAKNIHCPNCSCITHTDGKTTHFHSAISPVIVSPGHAQVAPLRPEFITPQDGHAKQDCEIAAAKRWLAAHAARYTTGNDTLLGDDLYAHQPFCRQVLLHGFHFLFTCKPASHPHLSQWVEALVPGRDLHTLKLRTKGKSNRWEHHTYRWAHAVPLTADNVAGLVSAGRARWKIENENNNVLKTKGYHLEHNFGHGQEHLSSLLATMNLLAFALHTFLELADDDYRLIRGKVGARRTFFEHLRALTTYLPFDHWRHLMDFMMRGLEIGPPAPVKS